MFFLITDNTVRRPTSLIKSKSSELDGADEKMLINEIKESTLKKSPSITYLKNEKQNGEVNTKLNIGKCITLYTNNFVVYSLFISIEDILNLLISSYIKPFKIDFV